LPVLKNRRFAAPQLF
ncbi:hypothetical protein, partial [Cronobacter sakazakii]